jgi:RNA-directed DNA polymerase
MTVRHQKIQQELALTTGVEGEAFEPAVRDETVIAKQDTESPAENERLMEEICEGENLRHAYKQVLSNKGSPGIDGMRVEELKDYLQIHWQAIKEQLLSGKYRPQSVKRVEIPKPNGGTRKLGIPTVLDRFIQQAVMQVLQKRWDKTFSEHSYGFRPGRSAHQAVRQAQRYIAEGKSWVVDIDLEKFFDRVNHDILMSRIARRVKDKRVLKLIRGFLTAGVLEGGLATPTTEGTPQGGPLSPLLSNLLLDELDKELEGRGHRFVRYADDCNIYVSSQRAGERVMTSIGKFLTSKLKLRINQAKSAVAKPQQRKFLGFSFTGGKQPKVRLSPESIQRFKDRIRQSTKRSRGRNVQQVIAELTKFLIGWRAYFGRCDTPSVLEALDGWLRRRLRSLIWKQWKRKRKRFTELLKRGIGKKLTAQTVASCPKPWKASGVSAMLIAFPNSYFDQLGLPRLNARTLK